MELSGVKKFLFFLLSAFTFRSACAQEYLITQYGVKNDSTIIQTAAMQKIINEAAEKGGGNIVFPKGVFLTGALFFRPGTHLIVEEGGTIKGSDDISDYPLLPSRMEGRNLDYYSALINAKDVDGFSISGNGTINGNGLKFWKRFWTYRDSMEALHLEATNLDAHRPRLIFLWNCDSVKISDIKLRNAGFWTTHLYKCNDAKIINVDIRSPYKPVPAPSTDGIDLDVCSNVLIRGCYISVNDDAIAIKGGKGPWADALPENGTVEHIVIENCTFGNSHGALTLGSECIHARDIILRNCTVDSDSPVLRLKRRPDTPQIFEDITVENISGKAGTLISMFKWTQFYDPGDRKTQPPGLIRNISLRNINIACKSIGKLEGTENDNVSNIIFSDVQLTAYDNFFVTPFRNAVTLKNVSINGKPVILK